MPFHFCNKLNNNYFWELKSTCKPSKCPPLQRKISEQGQFRTPSRVCRSQGVNVSFWDPAHPCNMISNICILYVLTLGRSSIFDILDCWRGPAPSPIPLKHYWWPEQEVECREQESECRTFLSINLMSSNQVKCISRCYQLFILI